MICNECGKNNAEIYYKQTINGKTHEYALCAECAEKLKKEGKINLKMPAGFDDFHFPHSSFFNMDDFLGLPFGAKPQRIAEKKKCTLCSSTFDELVKSGRVGCAKCYEVFKDELRSSIESIHGKAIYIGSENEKPQAENNVVNDNDKINEKPQNELEKLKDELKQAIANEEFEKAAVLRDKIKALEESEG